MTTSEKPFFLRRVWSISVLIAYILICIYTLLVYAFARISPAYFWPAGFLTLSLPVMLALHIVFICYWLLISPWRALWSVGILVIGLPYVQRTLSIHPFNRVPESGQMFKVLSYNVRMLNTYHERLGVDPATSTQMLNWVINADADIKCIQELYNSDTSHVYNSMKQLRKRQRFRQYSTPTPDLYEHKQGYVGAVIFSRYPIIHYKKLEFDKSGINKGVYADILIGKDTIRVFNVHLQSMSIRVEKVLGEKHFRSAKNDLTDIFKRLKRGFISRAEQVSLLEKWIANSPYKVIVCSDLNDMPYSYTYTRLRKVLNNAFEEAGSGFGFTYNDRLFFLRIDNQFADKTLKVEHFTTHRNIRYSDHFPISATYSFK
jgi:endonuclease/exonuclease/phosphatase family metal-dependent hydrolase